MRWLPAVALFFSGADIRHQFYRQANGDDSSIDRTRSFVERFPLWLRWIGALGDQARIASRELKNHVARRLTPRRLVDDRVGKYVVRKVEHIRI